MSERPEEWQLRWLSAVDDRIASGLPPFPSASEQMLAARRAGKIQKLAQTLMWGAATGRTITVVGTDGVKHHHPDGTITTETHTLTQPLP